MMPGNLARAVLALGGPIELSIVLKATVVVGLTLVAARIARRARASVRHVLWASAFGALIMLPIVAVLLPPVIVEIPVSGVSDSTGPLATGQETPATDSIAGTSEPAHSRGRPFSSVSAWTLLRSGWAVGTTLFFAPVAVAFWRLRRIRRCSPPWLEGEMLVQALATRAGINRRVDVLLHDEMLAPVTYGLVRPTIVLPSDVSTWRDADVSQAVVHELEHVHRGDWLVSLVSRVVCALYWFHPLVWMAWGSLTLESERACDDAVLRSADGTAYAEQLVALARRLSIDTWRPGLSMANRSDLSVRISAVLDPGQSRGRAGGLPATLMAAAVFVIVLGISPLRVVAKLDADQLAPSQVADAKRSAFEVASIKPNASGDWKSGQTTQPGGRFTARNVTLRFLIQGAYGRLPEFRVSGGPSWIDSDRFDIIAKADGNPTPEQFGVMVRTLLGERFNLTLHNEIRQLSVYALVMARRDGKVGPQMRIAAVDCLGGRANTPPPEHQPSSCGTHFSPGGHLSAGGVTMAQVADSLSRQVNRVVLDRTRLTGQFDLNLEWTPGPGEFRPPVPADGPGTGDPSPVSGPSIFTALQEQLGLKLNSEKGPVNVLVVDHAERPTAN